MSYRLTKGAYYSHITKRTYQFKQGDATDQRRAKRQLESEDAAFKAAEAQRVANTPPDTRNRADVVRSEIVHKHQQSGEPGNAMSVRLAELHTALARAQTAPDRNHIQRRIDALQQRSVKHTALTEAAAERQARLDAPEVQAAIADATQLLDDFRFRGDVAESIVQGAASALESLKENLDVAAFKATAIELRSQHNLNRQAAMAQLRANIKTLESELLVVKADEAPAEAAPPQLVAAE